jgi:excisionase family DNA binding protein
MRQCDFNSSKEISILLSTNATKFAMGVGTTTIYKWCKEGKLTPIKFGTRCTRFRLSEIQALIEAHAVPTNMGGSDE